MAQPEPPPPAGVLALQQGAGNRAVAQLLSRQPAPIGSGKELDPEKWGKARPREKPAPERATRSDATSYESQPDALREVLERSFGESAGMWFSRLSDADRSNLTYTYNRMVDHGLWEHVRVIKRVEAAEKPTSLGPVTLYVAGKSASVLFEVYDGKALRDSMLADGERFGVDSGPMGALHPGQTSMREFSRKTTDGLHLSIGMGTDADAHIDKKSPTTRPKGQTTQADLVRSLEHHWQEVWPEFLRVAPGWLVKVPYFIYEWLVDKLAFVGAGPALPGAAQVDPEGVLRPRREDRRAARRALGGDDVQAGRQGRAPRPVAAAEGHGLRHASRSTASAAAAAARGRRARRRAGRPRSTRGGRPRWRRPSSPPIPAWCGRPASRSARPTTSRPPP